MNDMRYDHGKDAPSDERAAYSTPISIISNSHLLREGLASLLDGYLQVHVVATYAGETLPGNSALNPERHIVLLDSGIGRDQALAWTVYWCAQTPAARVVVLELTNDIDLIVECIESGANGYTLQGASVAEVARVIGQVCRGVATCSPEITARLFARLQAIRRSGMGTAPAHFSSNLTARELEVLSCVARGFSNKEIAAALVIEIHTVKHHIHNILEKLNASHRQDAARVALERGWISASPGGLASRSRF